LENAIEVLKSWLIYSPENIITKKELLSFFGMFGPFHSAMRKINSLVQALNKYHSEIITCDSKQSNCFSFQIVTGKIFYGWNNPIKDVNCSYVFNEHGKYYKGWDEIFQSEIESNSFFQFNHLFDEILFG
jgi:hypothetical protein